MNQDTEKQIKNILSTLTHKQHTQALTLSEQLIANAPNNAKAYALYSRVLNLCGQAERAKSAAAHALALDQSCYPALIETAAIAGAEQRFSDMAHCLSKMTQIQPQHAHAWFDLAIAYTHLNQHKKAYAALLQAQQLMPNTAMVYDQIAKCLRILAAPPRQWLAMREKYALLTNTAQAWTVLAVDYITAGAYANARTTFEKAITMEANLLPPRWGLMQNPKSLIYPNTEQCEKYLAEWESGLEWFEQQDFTQVNKAQLTACILQSTPFYLHYLGQDFVTEQTRYARVIERMMEAIYPQDQITYTCNSKHSNDTRIRIGFISGFMRNHTVTKLFGMCMEKLPREQFIVHAFQVGASFDTYGKHLQNTLDFFAYGEKNIDAWVNIISDCNLDVLVYLDVGMHSMVQALSTRRLAPLQSTFWGHPVTTGLKNMDLFFSCAAMEPENYQSHYTEEVILLPGVGSYFKPPVTEHIVCIPEIAKPSTTNEVRYTFLQSAFKIMPFHDVVLARIAQKVPTARFYLTSHHDRPVRKLLELRLAEVFKQYQLEWQDHLGFSGFVKFSEFLGLAQNADVNLDSIGWSGGNTTLEILWFDVPTVTLPGDLMRQRHTYAMLKILELPQLIAKDVDDYVHIASELGLSANFRAEMRALIHERKHRLYEDQSVIEYFQKTIINQIATRKIKNST